MFAGTLTRNVETAAAQYTGMIHGARFDIAIQLEARAKMSERSPDFDVTAVNKSGRKVRIGTAWNETGNTSGNPYISMQIDVGLGPFRVNAVQTKEARAAQSGEFEIIPLVSNGLMKSGSIWIPPVRCCAAVSLISTLHVDDLTYAAGCMGVRKGLKAVLLE